MSIAIKITITETDKGINVNTHCEGECSCKEADVAELIRDAVNGTLKQAPGYRCGAGESKRTIINEGGKNVH